MKGLIIKPKWAELILSGEKTIEVRGSKTNIHGKIGIIESGSKKVFGTVFLYHCFKINRHNFGIMQSSHMLTITYEELLEIYPNPYGWCIEDAKRYDIPVSYEHKQGCVIWVNL